MADIYVRSSDGNDADNGSTWALAKATLSGAFAIEAAGDNVYVSSSHSESTAASVTLTSANNDTSPVRLISVTDTSEPPTTATNGAVMTTTGASSIIISGSTYVKGITFNVGTGTSSANWQSQGANHQLYEDCIFNLLTTSSSSAIYLTNSSDKTSEYRNCVFSMSNDQCLQNNSGTAIITGGSISSTSSTNGIVRGLGKKLLINGCDLSGLPTNVNLVSPASISGIVFLNCKLPASWSGSLLSSGARTNKLDVRVYNCDSGATNYKLWIETYAGTILSETTLVKSGGATDGTTPISWKLTTTSTVNMVTYPLITDTIVIWNEATGASKTLTIDILHDSVTALTDADVWVEVMYLSSTGAPISTLISDRVSTILASASSQTSSSATWTTTGMTNPNKQKLEVTFTPQMKGFIHAKVCMAKPSYTIYVDPKPVIT